MVWPLVAAAAVTAASTLAGGLMGQSSQKKAAKQSYKHQKEFAQNSVLWRVRDAERSGINPYFALGAPTMSFSDTAGVDPLPQAIAEMGQDVSRAMTANADSGQKAMSLLERAQLENINAQTALTQAKTASELRLATQPGSGPGMGATPGTIWPGLPVRDVNAGQVVENYAGDGLLAEALNWLNAGNDIANATPEGRSTLATTKREIANVVRILDHIYNSPPRVQTGMVSGYPPLIGGPPTRAYIGR